MALLKEIVLETTYEGISVKWVNENGHDVCYCPSTPYLTVGTVNVPQRIYLTDPSKERESFGAGEHYRIMVQGMTICGAGHYTHTDGPFLLQGDHKCTEVDTVPLLPEHYLLFMVLVDDAFYPMTEYYEKELYKA